MLTTAHAAALQWDAAPATPGLQDAAGNLTGTNGYTTGNLLRSGALTDQPIFANTAFRFFPARMDASGLYQGVYRSSDGMTISKDGDPAYTWTNARLDKLYLQTGDSTPEGNLCPL